MGTRDSLVVRGEGRNSVRERVRHVKRTWHALDAREICRAAGIGKGPSVSRGVVCVEQVLEPDVEAMSPLCVEEVAARQIDTA